MGLLTGEILPGSGWKMGFISSLPFLKLNLLFNWRKIALQCCTGFCHTTTRINHSYTYITSLLSLSPLPPHPTPLGHHRVPGWAPCAIQQLLTSYLFSRWWYIYVNATFSVCPTLSAVFTSPFSTSVSLAHFPRFHIYALIHICFSLSALLHSV